MQSRVKLALLLLPVLYVSCENSVLEMPSKSKKDVFEAFWKGIDERYSYFDLKKIDWDAIRQEYALKISEDMSEEAFFDTLSVLIDLLRDGHSGIKSPFDFHKNPGFYLRGPENVDERLIVDHYSKGWGKQKGSLRHFELIEGKVAYVYYGSFSDPVTDDDIDYLIEKYKNTQGLILDIRNNFGGSSYHIYTIAKRFFDTPTLVFSSKFKNGYGHNDFAESFNVTLDPAKQVYKGKVCVLTNRKVYSAASIFALVMREAPNVTLVGDTTGGGLGLPVGFELPNEWQVYCAGTKVLSVDGLDFELGIPPDIQVDMKAEDKEKGRDSIIEKALEIILGGQ